MLKLIKILLIIAVIGGLFYFAYPIIKNRYFNVSEPENKSDGSIIRIDNTGDSSDNSNQTPASDENTPESAEFEKSLSGEKPAEDDSAPSININERNAPDGETLARITTEHCDSECKAFAMDLKLLEYCQQTCGIAPIKEVSNCDNKSNLEKDYCFKDLAINKKDSSLCEKIQDANIKLTCQNRILQDIIEGQ